MLRIFPRGGDTEQGVSDPVFHSSATCIETCRRAGELTQQLADDQQQVFWLDINPIFLRSDNTINTGLLELQNNLWQNNRHPAITHATS